MLWKILFVLIILSGLPPAMASQDDEEHVKEPLVLREGLEQAEIAFRKAIELISDENSIVGLRYGLAEVLRAQGRQHEAVSILQELLEGASVDDHPLADYARIAFCDLRRSLSAPVELEASPSRDRPPVLERENGAAEGPIYVTEDVRPPSGIFNPQPRYAKKARKARIQGEVIVQAAIDKFGCVIVVKVLKSLDRELDENSVSAISRWIFRPATLDGRPVDVYYNLTVNYRLK